MDNAVLMEIEKPAPGESGGSAREVSGGVSGRNAIPAPGTSVPADCLASAGTGRRRSLRTGSRAGAGDRAGCRLANGRAAQTSLPWTASASRRREGTGIAGNRIAACRLPGALLSRKWKGRTILVEVLAKGFRYENRHYSSLSAIAVAITGTRWNGLAFFGLTRPAGGERKERPRAEK